MANNKFKNVKTTTGNKRSNLENKVDNLLSKVAGISVSKSQFNSDIKETNNGSSVKNISVNIKENEQRELKIDVDSSNAEKNIDKLAKKVDTINTAFERLKSTLAKVSSMKAGGDFDISGLLKNLDSIGGSGNDSKIFNLIRGAVGNDKSDFNNNVVFGRLKGSLTKIKADTDTKVNEIIQYVEGIDNFLEKLDSDIKKTDTKKIDLNKTPKIDTLKRGSKNVTVNDIIKTFGVVDVTIANAVKKENKQQEALNKLYDNLLQLSETTGIATNKIGQGLSFNLTKIKGTPRGQSTKNRISLDAIRGWNDTTTSHEFAHSFLSNLAKRLHGAEAFKKMGSETAVNSLFDDNIFNQLKNNKNINQNDINLAELVRDIVSKAISEGEGNLFAKINENSKKTSNPAKYKKNSEVFARLFARGITGKAQNESFELDQATFNKLIAPQLTKLVAQMYGPDAQRRIKVTGSNAKTNQVISIAKNRLKQNTEEKDKNAGLTREDSSSRESFESKVKSAVSDSNSFEQNLKSVFNSSLKHFEESFKNSINNIAEIFKNQISQPMKEISVSFGNIVTSLRQSGLISNNMTNNANNSLKNTVKKAINTEYEEAEDVVVVPDYQGKKTFAKPILAPGKGGNGAYSGIEGTTAMTQPNADELVANNRQVQAQNNWARQLATARRLEQQSIDMNMFGWVEEGTTQESYTRELTNRYNQLKRLENMFKKFNDETGMKKVQNMLSVFENFKGASGEKLFKNGKIDLTPNVTYQVDANGNKYIAGVQGIDAGDLKPLLKQLDGVIKTALGEIDVDTRIKDKDKVVNDMFQRYLKVENTFDDLTKNLNQNKFNTTGEALLNKFITDNLQATDPNLQAKAKEYQALLNKVNTQYSNIQNDIMSGVYDNQAGNFKTTFDYFKSDVSKLNDIIKELFAQERARVNERQDNRVNAFNAAKTSMDWRLYQIDSFIRKSGIDPNTVIDSQSGLSLADFRADIAKEISDFKLLDPLKLGRDELYQIIRDTQQAINKLFLDMKEGASNVSNQMKNQAKIDKELHTEDLRTQKQYQSLDGAMNKLNEWYNDSFKVGDTNFTRKEFYSDILKNTSDYTAITQLYQDLNQRIASGEFKSDPQAFAIAIKQFIESINSFKTNVNNAVKQMETDYQTSKSQEAEGNKQLAELNKMNKKETRVENLIASMQKSLVSYDLWMDENKFIGDQNIQNGDIGFVNAQGQVTNARQMRAVLENMILNAAMVQANAGTMTDEQLNTFVRDAKNAFDNVIKIVQSSADDTLKLQQHAEAERTRLIREATSIQTSGLRTASNFESQLNKIVRNPTMNTLFANSGDPYLKGNIKVNLTEAEGLEIGNRMNRIQDLRDELLREVAGESETQRIARWTQASEQLAYEQVAHQNMIERIGVRVRPAGEAFNEYQDVYAPLMQRFGQTTGFNIFKNPNERSVNWETIGRGFVSGNRGDYALEIAKFINFPSLKDGLKSLWKDLEGIVSSAAKMLQSAFSKLSHVLVGVTAAIGGVTAGVTGAIAAFGAFGKSVVNTTDEFRRNTLALTGVYRTPTKAHEMLQVAYATSASMPMSYSSAMTTLNEISAIPSVQRLLRSPDSKISSAMMEKMFKVITAMTTMRPDKTASDAVFSLRNAFAGDLRSLQRRFDLPVNSISNTKNTIGLGKVKNDPMAMLDSLNNYFDSFLDMDVITQVSRTIGVITEKIKGSFDLFKANIGNSGLYDLVLKDVDKIKDIVTGFVDSDYGKEIARRISDALGNAYEAVKGIAEKIGKSILGAFGFDKDNIDIANIITTLGESFAKFLRYVESMINSIDIEGYIKNVVDYISNIDINDIIDGLKQVGTTLKNIAEEIVSFFQKLNNGRKSLGISDATLGKGLFFMWLFGPNNVMNLIGSTLHTIQSSIMTVLGAIGTYITAQTALYTAQGVAATTAVKNAITSLFTTIKTGMATVVWPITAVATEIYLIGSNFEVIGETFANVFSTITGLFENFGNTIDVLMLKYDKFMVNANLPDRMKQNTLNKYRKNSFDLNNKEEFDNLITEAFRNSNRTSYSTYANAIEKHKDRFVFNSTNGVYSYKVNETGQNKLAKGELLELIHFANYLTKKSDTMTKEEINDTLDKRIAEINEKIDSNYEKKYEENQKLYNPNKKKWSLTPDGSFFGIDTKEIKKLFGYGDEEKQPEAKTTGTKLSEGIQNVYSWLNNKLTPFINKATVFYKNYKPEQVLANYAKAINKETNQLNTTLRSQKSQYSKGFNFSANSLFGDDEKDTKESIYFGPMKLQAMLTELSDSVKTVDQYTEAFNGIANVYATDKDLADVKEAIKNNQEAIKEYKNAIIHMLATSVMMIEDGIAQMDFSYVSKDINKYVSAQSRAFDKKITSEVFKSVIQDYSSYFAIDGGISDRLTDIIESNYGNVHSIIDNYRSGKIAPTDDKRADTVINTFVDRLEKYIDTLTPIIEEQARIKGTQANIGNMRLEELNTNWKSLLNDRSKAVRDSAGERYMALLNEGIEKDSLEKMATRIVEITTNSFADMRTLIANGIKQLITDINSSLKNGLVKLATEGGTVKPIFKEMEKTAKKAIAGVYAEKVSNDFTNNLFKLLVGSDLKVPETPEEAHRNAVETELNSIDMVNGEIFTLLQEKLTNIDTHLSVISDDNFIKKAISINAAVINGSNSQLPENVVVDSSQVVPSIRGSKKDISTITALEFAESARATAEARYAKTGMTGYCASGWADNLANFTGGDRYYARAQFGLKGPDAHDYYNQLKTNPNWRRVQMDYSKTDNESILKQLQIGDTLVWWANKYKRNKKGQLKPAEHIGTYIGGGELASDFIESLYSYGSKGSSEWIQNRIKLYGLPAVYRLRSAENNISKIDSLPVKYDVSETYGDPLLNKATRRITDIGKDRNKYDDLIKKAAEKYNLEVNLIKGLINTESSFVNLGENSKGAKGLMQVKQTSTDDVNRWYKTNYDRDKIEDNIMIGSAYLRYCLDKFNNNLPVALTAYNVGPFSDNGIKNAITKGNNYASTVLMFKDIFDKELVKGQVNLIGKSGAVLEELPKLIVENFEAKPLELKLEKMDYNMGSEGPEKYIDYRWVPDLKRIWFKDNLKDENPEKFYKMDEANQRLYDFKEAQKEKARLQDMSEFIKNGGTVQFRIGNAVFDNIEGIPNKGSDGPEKFYKMDEANQRLYDFKEAQKFADQFDKIMSFVNIDSDKIINNLSDMMKYYNYSQYESKFNQLKESYRNGQISQRGFVIENEKYKNQYGVDISTYNTDYNNLKSKFDSKFINQLESLFEDIINTTTYNPETDKQLSEEAKLLLDASSMLNEIDDSVKKAKNDMESVTDEAKMLLDSTSSLKGFDYDTRTNVNDMLSFAKTLMGGGDIIDTKINNNVKEVVNNLMQSYTLLQDINSKIPDFNRAAITNIGSGSTNVDIKQFFNTKEPSISTSDEFDRKAYFASKDPVLSTAKEYGKGGRFVFRTNKKGNLFNRYFGGFMSTGDEIGSWTNNMLFGTGKVDERGIDYGNNNGFLGIAGEALAGIGQGSGGLGGILNIAGGLASGKGILSSIGSFLGSSANLTSPAGIVGTVLGGGAKLLMGGKIGGAVASKVTGALSSGLGSAILPVAAVASVLSKKGWFGGAKDRTAEGRARGAEFNALRDSLVANRNTLARNYYMANDDTLEAMRNYEFGTVAMWTSKRGSRWKGTRRRIMNTDATAFTNSMQGYWDLLQKATEEANTNQRNLDKLANTNNLEALRQTGTKESTRLASIAEDLAKYEAAVSRYAGHDTGFTQTLFDGQSYTMTQLNDKVQDLIKELGDSKNAIAQNTEAIRQEKLATAEAKLDYETALYGKYNPLISQQNEIQKLKNEWNSVMNDDGTIGYKEGTKEWFNWSTRMLQATDNLEEATKQLEESAKQFKYDVANNWVSTLTQLRKGDGTYSASQVKNIADAYRKKVAVDSVGNSLESVMAGLNPTELTETDTTRELVGRKIVGYTTQKRGSRWLGTRHTVVTPQYENVYQDVQHTYTGTSPIAKGAYTNIVNMIKDYNKATGENIRWQDYFTKTPTYATLYDKTKGTFDEATFTKDIQKSLKTTEGQNALMGLGITADTSFKALSDKYNAAKNATYTNSTARKWVTDTKKNLTWNQARNLGYGWNVQYDRKTGSYTATKSSWKNVVTESASAKKNKALSSANTEYLNALKAAGYGTTAGSLTQKDGMYLFNAGGDTGNYQLFKFTKEQANQFVQTVYGKSLEDYMKYASKKVKVDDYSLKKNVTLNQLFDLVNKGVLKYSEILGKDLEHQLAMAKFENVVGDIKQNITTVMSHTTTSAMDTIKANLESIKIVNKNSKDFLDTGDYTGYDDFMEQVILPLVQNIGSEIQNIAGVYEQAFTSGFMNKSNATSAMVHMNDFMQKLEDAQYAYIVALESGNSKDIKAAETELNKLLNANSTYFKNLKNDYTTITKLLYSGNTRTSILNSLSNESDYTTANAALKAFNAKLGKNAMKDLIGLNGNFSNATIATMTGNDNIKNATDNYEMGFYYQEQLLLTRIANATKYSEEWYNAELEYFNLLEEYEKYKTSKAERRTNAIGNILNNISNDNDYSIANTTMQEFNKALGKDAVNKFIGLNGEFSAKTIAAMTGDKSIGTSSDPAQMYYEYQKNELIKTIKKSKEGSEEWYNAETELWNLMSDNARYLKNKAESLPDTIDKVLGSMSGYDDYTIANSALTEFNKALGKDALNKLVGGKKGLKSFTDANIAQWFGVSGEDPYETYYEYQKKTIMDRIKNEKEGSEEWYEAELDLWNLMMENAKYLKEKAEKTTESIEQMLGRIEETAKMRVAEEAKSQKGDIIFFDLGASRDGTKFINSMLKAIKSNDPEAQKLVEEFRKKKLGA